MKTHPLFFPACEPVSGLLLSSVSLGKKKNPTCKLTVNE